MPDGPFPFGFLDAGQQLFGTDEGRRRRQILLPRRLACGGVRGYAPTFPSGVVGTAPPCRVRRRGACGFCWPAVESDPIHPRTGWRVPGGSNAGTGNAAPAHVKLDDEPPAGDPVHHSGADEIAPRATKPAGNVDDSDGLSHIFPIAAADAHPIGATPPVFLGAQIDRRHLFAFTGPVPTAPPSGTKTTLPVQRFTSMASQDSPGSHPKPGGSPDPIPPIMRSRFFRNRLESRPVFRFLRRRGPLRPLGPEPPCS